MAEKVLEALKALAERLGTTAEYLWGVLVKQGKVDFAIFAVCAVLAVTFTIIFFKLLKKYNAMVGTDSGKRDSYDRPIKRDWDTMVPQILTLVVLGLAAASFLIAAGALMSSGINGLVNPEYSALQKIFRLL